MSLVFDYMVYNMKSGDHCYFLNSWMVIRVSLDIENLGTDIHALTAILRRTTYPHDAINDTLYFMKTYQDGL